GGYGGGGSGRQNPYGKSRFDDAAPQPYQTSTYQTPGWQRAQQNWKTRDQDAFLKKRTAAKTIEGELVASSVSEGGGFKVGDRVSHSKFGGGSVTFVDGNKLTIAFDNGDTKRVVDSFVDRA